MKKLLIWSELVLKRLLLKKGFIALILALPLLGGFAAYWGGRHTTGVEAGLLKSADPTASQAIDGLLANEGLFHFILFQDAEAMLEAVKTRQLETAFIFAPDMTARLQRQENRDLIRLIRAPSTVTHGMAAEVVFAEVLEAASSVVLLRDIVAESGAFPAGEEAVSAEIITRYEQYRREGGTYRFSYEYLEGEPVTRSGIPLFPVKGLLAIFLMLTAWINVLSWYRDQEEGLYNAFSTSRRWLAGLIAVLLPVFIMTLAGFGLLLFVYPPNQALRELLWLSLYGVALSLFLYGAKLFFPTPIAYGALLPVALLGSLVASPVILDMSAYIENLAILEKLFLPSYYLGLSAGGQTWAGLGLALLAALGLAMSLLENKGRYRTV